MTTKELEERHSDLKWQSYKGEEELCKLHTKLSIEFAISVLEEVQDKLKDISDRGVGIFEIEDEIQELKQYVNDK